MFNQVGLYLDRVVYRGQVELCSRALGWVEPKGAQVRSRKSRSGQTMFKSKWAQVMKSWVGPSHARLGWVRPNPNQATLIWVHLDIFDWSYVRLGWVEARSFWN